MESNKMIYLNLQQAVELHIWLINNAGSSEKLNNSNYIDNILQEIQNDRNYPEFKHKLTQLIFAINKSEKAIADSKRLSIALSCFFLELNGYDYVVHYFAEEMENIVLWLEKNKLDQELLAAIIESLIEKEDYSEELKLQIAIAVSS